jgi:hypothetical protein
MSLVILSSVRENKVEFEGSLGDLLLEEGKSIRTASSDV